VLKNKYITSRGAFSLPTSFKISPEFPFSIQRIYAQTQLILCGISVALLNIGQEVQRKIMRTKLIVFSLLILSLFSGNKLAACSSCSGNGYVGAYSTGGYNLYSFATDIYTIIDTTYYSPVSTSGCGSLLGGCGSCYGSPGLNGGSSYNPNTQLINQLLISQINQNTMQMCLMSGMCNPTNPYLTQPGTSMPPLLPPGTNPPYSPYYPNVVSPQFPYSPNYPFPQTPYPQPPVAQIPYNGCDNIVVMCPSPPISP
jgi:hypothetical protein